jgi:CheY-like chemotaxis protein
LYESSEGGTFKGKGRVLLVENDEAVAFMVCQMLEKLGCSVVCHTDASAGCTAAVTNPGGFDLMVTDYSMPGMTGIELASAVYEKEPGLPVILFTGLGEQLDPDTGKTGIRAVLKKPVSIEDFAKALGRILGA